MELKPVPIVLTSEAGPADRISQTGEAMQAGAVAVVEKPQSGNANEESAARQLVRTIKLMAEVKLVQRRNLAQPRAAEPFSPANLATPGKSPFNLVAIGASAGGPAALQVVLAGLAEDFAVPVLIVQHITPGFLAGLVNVLGQICPLPIQIGTDEELPQAGRIYFAPDDYHLGLDSRQRLALSKADPEHGCRPAVSYLFRSVARELGPKAVGVLLTGMGRDGAAELKVMRDRGVVTIAQDAATSLVHGMPGEAIKLGGAQHVLAVEQIGPMLNRLVNKK
jgi:two-component system chemotaxis response regulator CheB